MEQHVEQYGNFSDASARRGRVGEGPGAWLKQWREKQMSARTHLRRPLLEHVILHTNLKTVLPWRWSARVKSCFCHSQPGSLTDHPVPWFPYLSVVRMTTELGFLEGGLSEILSIKVVVIVARVW